MINIDQLGSVELLRLFDPQNLTRQQDMIGDIIRIFRDQTRRSISRIYINYFNLVCIHKLVIFHILRMAIIHVHRCGLYCGACHHRLGWNK